MTFVRMLTPGEDLLAAVNRKEHRHENHAGAIDPFSSGSRCKRSRLSLVRLWRRAWLFQRLLIRDHGAMLGIGIRPVEHLLRCQTAPEVQAAGRTTPHVLTFITYVNFGKALSGGSNFKNVSTSRAGWSDAPRPVRGRPSRDGGPADFDSTVRRREV